MKRILTGLAILFGLVTAANAQVVPFPQSLPANTVVGRTGVSAGPAQAIPFAVLTTNLFGSLCQTSGAFPIFNATTATWVCSTTGGTGSLAALTGPFTASGLVTGGRFSSPYNGKMWTGDGASVNRFERVFTGGATVNAGDIPTSVKDWLETLIPATTTNAQDASLAVNGTIGILGGSRSADFGSADGGAIGVMGFAQNNQAASSGWGFYGEAWTGASANGVSTIGLEVDIVNKSGTVIDVTPFAMFPTGLNAAGWYASGGSRSGVTNASLAFGIIDNGAKFRKGIVYKDSALDTAVGAGGNGVAMEMSRNQSIRWLNSGAGTDTEIWGNASGFNVGPCTFGSTTVTCASASAFQPQLVFNNTTGDANSAFFLFQKNRSGGNTNSGDFLGQLTALGFANAAQRNSASVQFQQSAAVSGNNVPSKILFATSNTAGQLNQTMTFDQNAHLSVTAQATAPSISAGCNGAGSSLGTGSSDLAGNITGQTAAATTCTITFGTAFTNTPSCVTAGDQSAILTQTRSTTTLVVTFASTANYRFNWVCSGV